MSGLDHFLKTHQHLKKVALGILSNHATLAGSGYPAALELLRQGFPIKKIFSPEHGISSQGEDGREQPNETDPVSGLPVVSLYGQSISPKEEDLKDIEAILVDLPNIGCRFYTYWWTITYMMEACSMLKKKIFLLDRPNLSYKTKNLAEGPLLDEVHCSSFLGRWTMPLTYSQTYGELATWFNHERKLNLDLEVVSSSASNKEAVFIPTSPSMPDQQAVFLYPFTGLFEGLNLNTGRGTSFPFRVIGAPWINCVQLYEDFKLQTFSGLSAFPYTYRPEWSRYGGSTCYGLFFSVTDATQLRPVSIGLWLMNYLSIHYPDQLTQALYPTVVNPTGETHLDLLLGIRDAFKSFCSGKALDKSHMNRLLDVSVWVQRVDKLLKVNA